MTYEFFPKQEEFINAGLSFDKSPQTGTFRSKYKIIGFGGAIRGGKTYAGLGLIIIFCKLFPGSRWAVVRKALPDIRRNTLPDFYDLIPAHKLKQAPSQSNQWTAIIDNGSLPDSEIIFFPEAFDRDKDLNRWRGLRVNGFLLEEVNELQEESFNKAIERSGTHMMGHTWNLGEHLPNVYPSPILWTCNPSNGWVKDRFYIPWEDDELEPLVKYIPSRVFDNPHVPPEWIAEQKELLPDLVFEMFVNGNWHITFNERPFLYEWDDDKHVHNGNRSELIIANAPIYLSCDQNVEPPVITAYQKGRGFMHLIDETNMKTGSVYDLADWVRNRYRGFRLKITGDSSGHARSITARGNKSFYEILANELGLNPVLDIVAPRQNKRHEDSRILCNTVLKSHPRLLVAKECKRVLSDIRQAHVNKQGELVKSRKQESEYLDYFDTFRYAIATFFPDFLTSKNKYL